MVENHDLRAKLHDAPSTWLNTSLRWFPETNAGAKIRKMVGTLLVAARTGTPLVTLRALTDRRAPGRAHTPRAPAPGLILERPTFDGYNTRVRYDPSRCASI